MKQFALIGLSAFARRIIEELEDQACDVLLIDKDPAAIELYKDKAARAYVADVLNEETIGQLVPPDVDGVVLDPGDRIEVSILATNYLKKMGVKNIFVRAETDEQGEILELVGADHVIYPNREAAKRIAPMLLASRLFNYMPISSGLVIAEVKAPEELHGKSLVEADLRKKLKLNVVAVRGENSGEDFRFRQAEYRIFPGDVLLLAGAEEDVRAFAGNRLAEGARSGLKGFYNKLFR